MCSAKLEENNADVIARDLIGTPLPPSLLRVPVSGLVHHNIERYMEGGCSEDGENKRAYEAKDMGNHQISAAGKHNKIWESLRDVHMPNVPECTGRNGAAAF